MEWRLGSISVIVVGLLLTSCLGQKDTRHLVGPPAEAVLAWEGSLLGFRYPEGWKLSANVEPDHGSILLESEDMPGLQEGPLIFVDYYQDDTSVRKATQDRQGLIRHEAFGPASDVQTWKTKIGGQPARVIAYKWLPQAQAQRPAVEVCEIIAFVRTGPFMVRVSYYVQSNASATYEPDLAAVLASLTFQAEGVDGSGGN